MPRPLILLTNDDGWRARGLEVLRRALETVGEVVVCAPEAEQSASSHSLSLHRPLRLTRQAPGVFCVDGTPADSVYVALHGAGRVLSRPPELVVSGLNHGPNLGGDVFYSGTVAAAREAALKGVPAMAVSADVRADFEVAAASAAALARRWLQRVPVPRLLLNVNFPVGPSRPPVATRLGLRQYEDGVEFRRDPRGREYLWISGTGVTHPATSATPLADTEAYDAGIPSVTPLHLDLWEPEAHDTVQALLG